MWYFITGLFLGYLLKGFFSHKQTMILNKALADEKETLAKESLSMLRANLLVQEVLDMSYIFLNAGNRNSPSNGKQCWSVEASLCIEGIKYDGTWVSEFKGHSLILRTKSSCFKISETTLGSSPFDFHYSQLEIFANGELVLRATYRNFQNGENEWNEVLALKKEEFKHFSTLVSNFKFCKTA